jgi:hypothetical protein
MRSLLLNSTSVALVLVISQGCSGEVSSRPIPVVPPQPDAAVELPDAGRSGDTGSDPDSSVFEPECVASGPNIEISGIIAADRTLECTKNYLLKGLVQVKAGSTLTIQKGTTIKGENASKAILLIEAGGKLIAEGTANAPIVFTSQVAVGQRRAGDWGGLVILGKAPVNYRDGKGSVEGILKNGNATEFGGTDADDNSGVLRYVRVEYAGVELAVGNEVNGITFGGVGRGTKVDHVQVRHALDDCFEWFGGTVDAKYLSCQYNQDDGFDFDNGFSGRLQFLVLQQDPAHRGDDNGFESDNDAQGSTNMPFTNPTVYNATILGKNKLVDGLQFGIFLRRNSRGTYRNIVAQGFPAGLDIGDASTAANATNGVLSIQNSIFFGSLGANVADGISFLETGDTAPNKNNDSGFDEANWFKLGGSKNGVGSPSLTLPFDANTPGFGPAVSLVGAAATPPADGFFDANAQYAGAFKDAADGWATSGKWAVWTDK